MRILGIIPSRYGSTRFPGKALIDIYGKTMVQRVYEQSKKAKSLTRVVVATDDLLIFDHVKSFGGEVVMTDVKHPSGTDRCNEALQKLDEKFDFVINIQGDEPFIKPEQIDLLSSSLNQDVQLATLIMPSKNPMDLENKNIVKVVFNTKKEALYFSRHPIPFNRNIPIDEWSINYTYYRHIGIYAYRSDILGEICSLNPSGLEQAESLEQLRWLENGFKIHVNVTTLESYGVDTPEDLKKLLLERVELDNFN